eukprot:498086_1
MSKRTTPDDGYKDDLNDQPQKKSKSNNKDNIFAPEAAHNTLFNKLHNIRSRTLNTNSKHKHTKMLKDIYTNSQSRNERNRKLFHNSNKKTGHLILEQQCVQYQEQVKHEKHKQKQLTKQERKQLANKKIAQENMSDISQTSYNDMVNGYIREHETTEFSSDKHSFYKFIPNVVNYLCIKYYIKDTFVKLPYLVQPFGPMSGKQLKFVKITDDTVENMMNHPFGMRPFAGFILENVAYKETHQWKFKVMSSSSDYKFSPAVARRMNNATILICLTLKKALKNVTRWGILFLNQNSVIDLNLDFNKLEYKIIINNQKDVKGDAVESGVYSVCICCTKCKIQLVSYKTSQ